MGVDCCIASAASVCAAIRSLRSLALVQFVVSSHNSVLRVHWRRLRAAIKWLTSASHEAPARPKEATNRCRPCSFNVSRSDEAAFSDYECLLMAGSAFKRFVYEALLVLRCGRKQSCLPSHQFGGPEVHIGISITHLDFALAAIVVVSRLVQGFLTQTLHRFHLTSLIANIYSDIP